MILSPLASVAQGGRKTSLMASGFMGKETSVHVKQIYLNLHLSWIHVFISKHLSGYNFFFVNLQEERYDTAGFLEVGEIDPAQITHSNCIKNMLEKLSLIKFKRKSQWYKVHVFVYWVKLKFRMIFSSFKCFLIQLYL